MHPQECNDVVLISFMEALCIKRVMIMKPQSTLNSKQGNSLGRERVSVLCQLVLENVPEAGKHHGRYRRAGRAHPTTTNEGSPNEQMVNEGRPNCPSEIIYYFHLLSVAWR